MSVTTARPHRRLSLTQPTHSPESALPFSSDFSDLREVLASLRSLEQRLARLEDSMESRLVPSQSTVLTTPFQIVDRSGEAVVEVDSGENGASFCLYGKQGQAVARIVADESGTRFDLMNARGQTTASVTAAKASGVTFADGSGKVLSSVFTHPQGGAVTLNSADGHRAAVLGASGNGGRLDLNGEQGRQSVRIEARPTGGSVGVFHRAGHQAAVMAAWDPEDVSTRPTGVPSVRLSETSLPADAVGVFKESAGGGIRLYDRSGRVIAASS